MTEDPAGYSAVVFCLKLVWNEIGVHYGRLALVETCVEKIVEGGYGELIGKLTAEIVDYEKIAVKISVGQIFVFCTV